MITVLYATSCYIGLCNIETELHQGERIMLKPNRWHRDTQLSLRWPTPYHTIWDFRVCFITLRKFSEWVFIVSHVLWMEIVLWHTSGKILGDVSASVIWSHHVISDTDPSLLTHIHKFTTTESLIGDNSTKVVERPLCLLRIPQNRIWNRLGSYVIQNISQLVTLIAWSIIIEYKQILCTTPQWKDNTETKAKHKSENQTLRGHLIACTLTPF